MRTMQFLVKWPVYTILAEKDEEKAIHIVQIVDNSSNPVEAVGIFTDKEGVEDFIIRMPKILTDEYKDFTFKSVVIENKNKLESVLEAISDIGVDYVGLDLVEGKRGIFTTIPSFIRHINIPQNNL